MAARARSTEANGSKPIESDIHTLKRTILIHYPASPLPSIELGMGLGLAILQSRLIAKMNRRMVGIVVRPLQQLIILHDEREVRIAVQLRMPRQLRLGNPHALSENILFHF
jgi:hypothetical protein